MEIANAVIQEQYISNGEAVGSSLMFWILMKKAVHSFSLYPVIKVLKYPHAAKASFLMGRLYPS